MNEKAWSIEKKDLHYRIAAFVAKHVVKRKLLVLIFMVGATTFWLYHSTVLRMSMP